MTNLERARITAATVKFPEGQGVLVPGHLIATVAHIVEWSTTDGRMHMTLTDASSYERIKADGRSLLVAPRCVDPVTDLAMFGKAEESHFEESIAFEDFCTKTQAVPLSTIDHPLLEPFPVEMLTHTGEWVSGRAKRKNPVEIHLLVQTDVVITGGTSGGPCVTLDGKLLGVISVGLSTDVVIVRPHLAAPVTLARQMKNPRYWMPWSGTFWRREIQSRIKRDSLANKNRRRRRPGPHRGARVSATPTARGGSRA